MKNEPAITVFEKKRNRRRELAKLPFEKKIEIVVELQKAASEIRNDRRDRRRASSPRAGRR
jgi:hypothetical protein